MMNDTPRAGLPGASDNPASRKLPAPIEAAIAVLVEVAQSTDGMLLDDERQVDAAVEQLREAIQPRLLPAEMTPAIARVLGLSMMQTIPSAHLFRAAGAEIRTRVEDEQAFVLWRFLHLALQHGDGWAREADQLQAEARATIAARQAREETHG